METRRSLASAAAVLLQTVERILRDPELQSL
jgi:hypothetical protein